MIRLGVNIDHVATIRQARGGREPDPVWAAVLAELNGADGITVHLREDRRHIQERDVRILRETVRTRLNLEAAVEPEVIDLAIEIRPDQVTLVPERRQEVTTEGGLDVVGNSLKVAEAVRRLRTAGLEVSLFLDPDQAQIDAGMALGVEAIELHTGRYAEAMDAGTEIRELYELMMAGRRIVAGGVALHAGHGLNYQNVAAVAQIRGMRELNIGHSIVSRAVMVGFPEAVRLMKRAIQEALGPAGMGF
jgi:pyridoxine 5-phosphate synthase